MEEIKTYKDYIDTLRERFSADESVKNAALQRLEHFKETQPDQYEEYREEKIKRREARMNGEELPPDEEVGRLEEVANKVAFLLRFIDEKKKYGIPVIKEDIDEVKSLYGDKELRKILRNSEYKWLLFLLGHRKNSFSRKIETRMSAEFYYANIKKIYGVQWVPIFEFAQDAPSVDLQNRTTAKQKNYGGIIPRKDIQITEEERANVEYARECLKKMDSDEEEQGLNNDCTSTLNKFISKKSKNKAIIRKWDPYLYMLLVTKRDSFKDDEKKGKYERMVVTSWDSWKDLISQTLRSLSVIRIIGSPDDTVEIFDDEELDAIESGIEVATACDMIDNNGMIDREKLFKYTMQEVEQLRNQI